MEAACAALVLVLLVLSIALAVVSFKLWASARRNRVLLTIVSTSAALAAIAVAGGVPERYLVWAERLSDSFLVREGAVDRVLAVAVFVMSSALVATAHFEGGHVSWLLPAGYVAVSVLAMYLLFRPDAEPGERIHEGARADLRVALAQAYARVETLQTVRDAPIDARVAIDQALKKDLEGARFHFERLAPARAS